MNCSILLIKLSYGLWLTVFLFFEAGSGFTLIFFDPENAAGRVADPGFYINIDMNQDSWLVFSVLHDKS